MKKKIISLFLTLACVFGVFFGSTSALSAQAETASEPVDYASQVVLDPDGDSQTIEVTVKAFIDGDTTHFNATGFPNGILKARYMAVNTPESTGKLEEWGKPASKFTRSKLETATSIVIESEGTQWEMDSTGDRCLSWVWYKAPGENTYRNLNVELLQEGLARGSKMNGTRYGDACLSAFAQAQALELKLWSGEKDPDFFYGDSVELDLKELRLNIEQYENRRVAFEGVVAYYLNQGVYVESYDEESGLYFGIYVYYGFTSISQQATSILAIGNKVRITGVVQYYEGGQSYQVADLRHNAFLPTPEDIRLIEKGHAAANVETSATRFHSATTVTVTTTTPDGDQVTEDKVMKYAKLALNTSISMKNLVVEDAYTTSNGGDNDGAMTLTCRSEGLEITVRTVVLRDYLGNLITQDQLIGKTIDVQGVVDCYDGEYQIKVLSLTGLTVQGHPWPTPPTSSEPATSNDGGGCGSVVTISYVLPLLMVAAFVRKRKN